MSWGRCHAGRSTMDFFLAVIYVYHFSFGSFISNGFPAWGNAYAKNLLHGGVLMLAQGQLKWSRIKCQVQINDILMIWKLNMAKMKCSTYLLPYTGPIKCYRPIGLCYTFFREVNFIKITKIRLIDDLKFCFISIPSDSVASSYTTMLVLTQPNRISGG